MKIAVLVKQVPDTETNLKVSSTAISEAGVKWIVSPFDEHALEESLRLRDKTSAEITAISLGPDRVQEALRTAYALGVDKAVQIKDDSYNVLDSNYTAQVLAAYIKQIGADIVLAGHIAIDSQSSMVPSMIAQILGCANINNAISIEVNGNSVKAKREIEGGTGEMSANTPVVITASKGLNEPRYPSLKGIMASKKKQLETVDVSSLGVTAPKIEIASMEPPAPRPPGRVIEAETPEDKAKELVRLLREEAKVI